MIHARSIVKWMLAPSAAAVLIAAAGCQHRVAIEGGEKPIKIDMTITHKVDRELDEFFAFEKKYEQQHPATQPTMPDPATQTPPAADNTNR